MVSKAFVDETGIKSTEKIPKNPDDRKKTAARTSISYNDAGNGSSRKALGHNEFDVQARSSQNLEASITLHKEQIGAPPINFQRQYQQHDNKTEIQRTQAEKIAKDSGVRNVGVTNAYHGPSNGSTSTTQVTTNLQSLRSYYDQMHKYVGDGDAMNVTAQYKLNNFPPQHNSHHGNGVTPFDPAKVAPYFNNMNGNHGHQDHAAVNQHVTHDKNQSHVGISHHDANMISGVSKENEQIAVQPIDPVIPTHESQVPTELQKEAVIPKKSDVIHGKGISAHHPGNQFYRTVLKRYYKSFINGDRAMKKSIVFSVYKEITQQEPDGGQFLRYEKLREGYEPMDAKESFEFILHVLNDCQYREKRRKREREEESDSLSKHSRTIDVDGEKEENETSSEQLRPPTRPQVVVAEEQTAPSKDVSTQPISRSTSHVQDDPKICDKCRGTGKLPRSETATSSEQKSEKQKLLSSEPVTTNNDDSHLKTANINVGNNETYTAWESHLRVKEEQLGIPRNPNSTYPERVEEIEKRLRDNEERIQKMRSPLLDDGNIIQILEKAERKWGIEVPAEYNIADRVELVEKTAFNFMARLQVWL